MRKTFIYILFMVVLLSCDPSPESLAKKHCAIYEKYYQAEVSLDSSKMTEYSKQMIAMDSDLLQKYQYENPELLLQYVKLKEKCILDYTNKNNNSPKK